jgi:hypothetical protein
MIREWDPRPLRIAATVLAVLVILAMNFPPTKYARTTWCGYPARVDRWTRLTHQEQVRLGWRLAPGADEATARELCATCHKRHAADLTADHTHHLWVQPGLQMPDDALVLLMASLRYARPQLDDWTPVAVTTDARDQTPVLVLWPISQTIPTPGS